MGTYYVGNKGFIAVGKETSYATPVAATDYLKINSESLETDPGNVAVPTISGTRASNTLSIQGESMGSGNVALPFGPLGSMRLFAAAIGADVVTPASNTTPATTTLSAVANQGATSVTVASATGIAAGDQILIARANAAFSELHTVLSVATNTITLKAGETLGRGYPSGAAVTRIIPGTVHTLTPNENNIPSLTVEKALSTLASFQFAGMLVNKFGLKLATNAAAEGTYDLWGQPATIIVPSTASYVQETPFSVKTIAVKLYGLSDPNVKSLELDVDNAVKGEWTFRGSNAPQIAYSSERKITGKLGILLNSDTSLDYYTNAIQGTFGALNIAMVQGPNASCVVDMLNIQFGKPSLPLVLGANIVQEIPFTAYLIAGSAYDFQAVVTNTVTAAYV